MTTPPDHAISLFDGRPIPVARKGVLVGRQTPNSPFADAIMDMAEHGKDPAWLRRRYNISMGEWWNMLYRRRYIT